MVMVMRCLTVVVVVGAGCGDVENKKPDARPADAEAVDTPVDTPSVRCDLNKPFGDIMQVPGANTAQWDSNPSLSPDELTMYFASIRQAPGTANGDLYVATRANRDEAFGPAASITALNTGADERAVSIAPDGLTIYFHSSRATGTGYDIWFSTRANTAAPFDAPTALTVLNTTDIETNPNVAANGQTLYFARTPSNGPAVLWKSMLTGTGFGTATMVTELNNASAFGPVISADGLEMYFSSDRAGGLGGPDMWRATRASTSDPFGTPPTNLAALNTTDDDRPGWLSPDGCRLYFYSTRNGGSGSFDIWQATRPQ